MCNSRWIRDYAVIGLEWGGREIFKTVWGYGYVCPLLVNFLKFEFVINFKLLQECLKQQPVNSMDCSDIEKCKLLILV